MAGTVLQRAPSTTTDPYEMVELPPVQGKLCQLAGNAGPLNISDKAGCSVSVPSAEGEMAVPVVVPCAKSAAVISWKQLEAG